jgi:hypothetical protein
MEKSLTHRSARFGRVARVCGVIVRRLTPGLLACGLAGCVIDPAVWSTLPPLEDTSQRGEPAANSRELVKRIGYSNGQVSYFRTTNSAAVPRDKVRICLENNTGQPKAMFWTKAAQPVATIGVFSQPGAIGPLVTKRNGDRSCANFNLNQRVEWGFFDRGNLKKSDGMNLGNVDRTLIEFIWVRDY